MNLKNVYKIWCLICMLFCISMTQVYADELKENSWRYNDGIPIQEKENNDNIIYQFNTPMMKGIDVSKHQGVINWNLVYGNIDYAIIRCGYGNDETSQDDTQWYNNANACTNLDIPFGVYIYSYATNTSMAESEANHVLRLINGFNLSFPIYLDMEDNVQANLSARERGAIASTFCNIIQNSGYEVGIYANKNWWTNYLTDSAFNNPSWYKWVAQYNTSCTYSGNYTMWQYTSSGYVNGINGNVDMNYWYGEFRNSNSVTVNTTVADSITESNAIVRGKVSYSGQKPSEVGIYFGTSEGNMTKVANDYINHNKNPFDMWYDLNDEVGLFLDSNTKYYWQCYAIINGKEYKGEVKSFTTLNVIKPVKPIICNSTLVSGVKNDMSYIVEVNVENLSSENLKCTAIIVYRDDSGNIVDMHTIDIDIGKEDKLLLSDSIKGYYNISNADIYIFDTLNNLLPISNKIKCNFNE